MTELTQAENEALFYKWDKVRNDPPYGHRFGVRLVIYIPESMELTIREQKWFRQHNPNKMVIVISDKDYRDLQEQSKLIKLAGERHDTERMGGFIYQSRSSHWS